MRSCHEEEVEDVFKICGIGRPNKVNAGEKNVKVYPEEVTQGGELNNGKEQAGSRPDTFQKTKEKPLGLNCLEKGR